ncbi:MAG: hypothetical protein R3E44_14230 [Paracoccaceae bacterium]
MTISRLVVRFSIALILATLLLPVAGLFTAVNLVVTTANPRISSVGAAPLSGPGNSCNDPLEDR